MNPHTVNNPLGRIVYDADRMPEPDARWFSLDYWAESDSVLGQALGRGNALIIDAPFGRSVLRRYYRGGWVARVTSDQYVNLGASQSRSFMEFNLLASLYRKQLPVPMPIAASFEPSGLVYRAGLITRLIECDGTLAQMHDSGINHPNIWAQVGATIRKFHRAGVFHADLNARNILVDASRRKTWLVDFDKARYQPGKSVDGKNNLARLRRSLEKIAQEKDQIVDEQAWDALNRGYHD